MIKLIEIYGIGFKKGAELMLYSIVDQLRKQYGDGIAICCQPGRVILMDTELGAQKYITIRLAYF